MKAKMKKFFMGLMASVLMIGSIGAGTITASAEEAKQEKTYEATDPYVIYYDGGTIENYSYTQPWYWVTPYLPSFSTEGDDATYHWPIMFNMVNTSLIDASKTNKGFYASTPVYCTDILTGTATGTNYRRIDLEDSSYYNDDYSEKIRAIFMNSFPYIMDMGELAENVNKWVGEDVVVGLTTAEALSATQTAIWIMANSDECEIYEYCMAEDTGSYTDSSKAKILDKETVDPDAVDNRPYEGSEVNPPKEQTIKNIESLCKYLLALKPMPAQDSAISEHSLKNVTTSYKKLENGTYDVTVSYEVDATIHQEDELTISAKCGEERKTYALTKAGEDSITLNVTELGEVTLEINGTQTTAGDVYLYEAINGRDTSQNMVGYDTKPVPVHAEVKVTQRVLNFYKTTSTDQGRKALEGVKFDIYLITQDIEAYNKGEVELLEKPTEEYAKEKGEFVTTIITDAQGKATCNLSDLAGKEVITGNGDGIYLIVEQGSAAVEKPIDPFFVCVPMTSVSGDAYIYNINIEPKNTVVNGPKIYKDVTEIDNDHSTYDVNAEHTWIIRTTVPADIAEAKEYKITDVLDYRLTYKGNPEVKVGLSTDKAGEEANTLIKGNDYKVLTGKTSTDGKQVDKFIVYLTATGMKKVAGIAGAAAEGQTYEVRVYFDAVINTNAEISAIIPNQATLDYTNSYGYEYDTQSDEPEVHTGGLSILKYDANDEAKLLSGATFKLVRLATDEEIKTGETSDLVINENTEKVVYAEFYDSADLSGAKASEVTTVAGNAVMYGLAYGEYYLVEIKAPAGYNLLSKPVKVVIDEDSHTANGGCKVANSNTFKLPETGGIGTTIFTVGGVLLITAAVVILIVKKKKENEAEEEN